jgi:hypothetical protein
MPPPETIEFRCLSWRALGMKDNLRRLVELLDGTPTWRPTHWAYQDGKAALKYSPETFLKAVAKLELDASYSIDLLRRKGPKYKADFPLWSEIGAFDMSLLGPKDEKECEKFFAFAGALVELFRPMFAILHMRWMLGKLSEQYNRTYQLSANDFLNYGPIALCARTWAGAHVFSLLGKENLLAVGLHCRETSWGGLEIDLVPEPWQSDFETVSACQKKAMKKLKPLGVLGDYRGVPIPTVAGARWTPPGA